MNSNEVRLALLEQKMTANTVILERHEGKLDAILEGVTELRVAHGKLEVRAGLWGGLAGLIPAAVLAAKSYITGKT